MVGDADFVAHEGFELIANAVNEMESPEKTLPASLDSYSGSITVNPTSPVAPATPAEALTRVAVPRSSALC